MPGTFQNQTHDWPYLITLNFPWDGSSWDVYTRVGPDGVCRVVCVRGRHNGREYITPNLDAFMDGRLRDFNEYMRSGGSGGRSPSRSRRGSNSDPKK